MLGVLRRKVRASIVPRPCSKKPSTLEAPPSAALWRACGQLTGHEHGRRTVLGQGLPVHGANARTHDDVQCLEAPEAHVAVLYLLDAERMGGPGRIDVAIVGPVAVALGQRPVREEDPRGLVSGHLPGRQLPYSSAIAVLIALQLITEGRLSTNSR